MKKSYLIALSLLLVILMPLAAGCSNKAMGENSDARYDGGSVTGNSAQSEAKDGIDYDYNYTKDENTGTVSEAEAQYERKIIKTVNISGETKEFDAATKGIGSYVAKHGGYIEKSNESGKSISNNSGYTPPRGASFTVRVPAENLDGFLSELGGLINVVGNSSSIDDVSAQYYDILSRLATLNAENEALLKMLEKAENIDQMLKIEERRYDVTEEIEAYTTMLNYYKNKVAYSTVYIEVKEVIEYTEQVKEPATFGERISAAFKNSWQDFADGWQNFSVGLVYAIPTLLVLTLIFGGGGYVVYLIIRRARKKK